MNYSCYKPYQRVTNTLYSLIKSAQLPTTSARTSAITSTYELDSI